MECGRRDDGKYWIVLDGVELHRVVTVLAEKDIFSYPDAFIKKINGYAKQLRRLLEGMKDG